MPSPLYFLIICTHSFLPSPSSILEKNLNVRKGGPFGKEHLQFCALLLLSLFILLALTLTLTSTSASASDGPGPGSGPELTFCRQGWDDLPIRQQGRIKPLYVQARESVRYLTGQTDVGPHSAVTAYCLLSLRGVGLDTAISFQMPIDHVAVRELLNLKEEVTRISYDAALEQVPLFRQAMAKASEGSSLKKTLQKHLNQMGLYRDIAQGTHWMFPAVGQGLGRGPLVAWRPLVIFITQEKLQEKVAEIGQEGVAAFIAVVRQSQADYVDAAGDDYLLELSFVKAHLTWWTMLAVLLALASFVLLKGWPVGLFFYLATLSLQIVIITVRVLISGRAPITNMYETVLFSGLGGLLLAGAITIFKKEKRFLLAGLSYNLCTLWMLNFADNMLSPSISPLVPVLRDNFWLSTHVTTVILSYAAMALSWMLANTALFRRRFSSSFSSSDQRYYSGLIYTCLKVGVVLLATGVILGGVWADYSWGRFWGWDPKETWSLVALCTYMAILHGKATSWIPPRLFIPLVAMAFLSVVMAWFGVNYILATGLHSYGFSQGGAIFLGSFFAMQILFLIITLWRWRPRQQPQQPQ